MVAADAKLVSIKINGNEYKVPEGMTVLEACQEQGIPVPFVCHHPRLAPLGRIWVETLTYRQVQSVRCGDSWVGDGRGHLRIERSSPSRLLARLALLREWTFGRTAPRLVLLPTRL